MKRALILACAAILAGCSSSGEQQDIKAWMDEQAKGMRGAVRTLPEISTGGAVQKLLILACTRARY